MRRLSVSSLDSVSKLCTYWIECFLSLRVELFHIIRYKLQNESLITNGPKELYCGQRDDQGHCYVAAGKMQYFMQNKVDDNVFSTIFIQRQAKTRKVALAYAHSRFSSWLKIASI